MDNGRWIAIGLVGLTGAQEVHHAFAPVHVNAQLPVIEQYRMPTLPHGGESTSSSTRIASLDAIGGFSSTASSTSTFQIVYADGGWPPVFEVKV